MGLLPRGAAAAESLDLIGFAQLNRKSFACSEASADVLQCRDDIRSIRYHDVGTRLRDMTVCDRLIECVIRGAVERDHVTLRARPMGLETLDHIVSIGAGGEHERIVADATVEGEADRSGRQCGRIDGVVAGAAY